LANIALGWAAAAESVATTVHVWQEILPTFSILYSAEHFHLSVGYFLYSSYDFCTSSIQNTVFDVFDPAMAQLDSSYAAAVQNSPSPGNKLFGWVLNYSSFQPSRNKTCLLTII
jgi:hypothetical protein